MSDIARVRSRLRHLIEICRGHLPHRAIELQLLDRSQREHLLALECCSRSIRKATLSCPRRILADERHQRRVECCATYAGGADGEAQEHEVFG